MVTTVGFRGQTNDHYIIVESVKYIIKNIIMIYTSNEYTHIK